MYRFISFILLLSVLAGSLPAQDRASVLRKILLDADSETVLVAAHRASHKAFPENSIPAIRDAVRLGVDILELDVKITADGIPILMHDRTIDRTTTGRGDPEKITWKDLRKLSLLHNGRPSQEKIPTLEEALLEVKGKALVDLDMKTDAVPEVLEVVRKTGMQEQVFFFDSDREVLANILESGPFMVMPRARDLATTREVLDMFNPPIVHIDPSFNTPEVTGLIKARKARAWINALGPTDREIAEGNGIAAVQALLSAGASIVQTDEPQLLTGLLHQLGKRREIASFLPGTGPQMPAITAHRSKINRFSVENTLSTMKKALALGVDYIEVDVRTTRDGEIVVFHDGTLNRTTRSKGALKDCTLAELKNTRLKKAPKSERIPTLEEVCRLVAEWNEGKLSQTHLYVDCKEVAPSKLIGILQKYNLHRQAVFYGGDELLTALKDVFPEARLMPALRSGDELARKAALLCPYAFDVSWKALDQELVSRIHHYRIRVFSDLLALDDKKKSYRKAADFGVDVIQTDRPRKARKSLAGRGEASR